MKIFVTAIGTDSGKTLVSALLSKALQANYWKPIQAGLPADKTFVSQFISSEKILPEQYELKTPASPHYAAQVDGVNIRIDDIKIPAVGSLVIEGAGGCLVPINDHEFVIDIAIRNKLPIVLVANLYLGSINHTLLTTSYLKQVRANVLGIVFNGEAKPASQNIISKHCPWPIITHIPQLADFTTITVQPYVEDFRRFFTK